MIFFHTFDRFGLQLRKTYAKPIGSALRSAIPIMKIKDQKQGQFQAEQT